MSTARRYPSDAPGVTYDAGMLIAVDRGDRQALARHKALLTARRPPTVPAGVLAQVWRSGRQAELARVVGSCDVEPLTEVLARAVGVLAASTGHPDVVDLSVVEGALRRGDRVATSDPADLLRAGLPPGRITVV
ncbi:twitching motility protein PilT [Kineosporia sp. R_H_3]|uniref:twitching motility protein PilT n=1 Tax=Kineosporia sp. R_H_3 TaxID=1961848 RepID=UPI00117B330A|nr:twitching motility protein PilT [Kineosporia sp. R_H_3]